jgi:RNase P subunit RPR2
LDRSGQFNQNDPMTSHSTPAQIRAWIECPQCDHCVQPIAEARIASQLTNPGLEKLHATCDRCGGYALLYLQRDPRRIH